MKFWLELTIFLLFQRNACSFVPHPCRRLSRLDDKRQTFDADFFRSKKQDDDGDLPPGMMDAFKKLESLDALGDGRKLAGDTPQKKISGDKVAVPAEETKISAEKEVQMYSKMMQDLESTDDDDLYSDVMSEMGGEAQKKSILSPPKPSPSKADNLTDDVVPAQPSKEQMDRFMDDAFSEALEEVKLKSTDSLSAESILNDKEIMKEIEAIFDRGSEELAQSLEQMRKEQESFARKSAESSAQEAADVSTENAERLARAEVSMAGMLNRVSKEAVEVEKAAQDLRNAQAEIDKDFIVKLRKGGIPKQAALVGFLLFSVRSIGDTVAAFSDESLLAGALLQGGIALACAAAFFLV
mmetsp:Transcript_16367/g.21419  ORF Transcript_16367/g.21419 Transcript_16367/m.21419 type:complete len:354 (+) Transcript_16367:110-1171(+)|eukprot:CAMPEP_0198138936 /NCGR_PEP_ID=MMETSP1443-20131203/2298_1 /TAXON_ID=186043 /ORGANISM="Entomoneis sp., Strain CCMP2396" /LENGTH=353 /DNA_ID=CAMNT_0043800893 /DNA_START=38 /DNA_END=1099 /DNA_ORIENTATION=-